MDREIRYLIIDTFVDNFLEHILIGMDIDIT